MPRLILSVFAAFWLLVSSALADLKIGTLNCYFLFDPGRPEKTQLKDKGPTAEQYIKKTENLASLMKDLDVVALQEIGGEGEARDEARLAGDYKVCFVQGKDTFTGQDVAVLVKPDARIKVLSVQRNQALESLSKHVVVILTEGGKRYAILNVHLIRPIGTSAEKHARQLAAISEWIADVRNRDPQTVIVVMGDFNNTKPALPLAGNSDEKTGHAPTHLVNQAFDHIFTSGKLSEVEIVRPPYPKRPNDDLKMLWTDHYLLKASVGPES